MSKPVLPSFRVVWSPTGRTLAVVQARNSVVATQVALSDSKNAAYRRYPGEIYTAEILPFSELVDVSRPYADARWLMQSTPASTTVGRCHCGFEQEDN